MILKSNTSIKKINRSVRKIETFDWILREGSDMVFCGKKNSGGKTTYETKDNINRYTDMCSLISNRTVDDF